MVFDSLRRKVKADRRFIEWGSSYIHKNVYKSKFCSNEVVSSRYTVWSFLPKSLMEQLMKLANFWFLINSFLFLYAETPLKWYSTVVPLAAVIVFAMSKDLYDDLKRHRQDNIFNRCQYSKYCVEIVDDEAFGYWCTIPSKELAVGNLVMVTVNDQFPCDILPLYSSDIRRDINVVTSNIDGEVNIKKFKPLFHHMRVPAEFKPGIDYESRVSLKHSILERYTTITYDNPFRDFNSFKGEVVIDDNDYFYVNKENLLLRSTKLVNTNYIIGIVLYTGKDTKLSLNTQEPIKKFSVTERKINTIIIFFVFFVFLIPFVLKVLEVFIVINHKDKYFYLSILDLTPWIFFKNLINSVIIFNYLTPISLIVVFEILQLVSTYFIESDIDLYDDTKDYMTKANNMSICDQLGQINFIFSDKTGTLTQNNMQFRAIYDAVSETYYGYRNGKIFKVPPDFDFVNDDICANELSTSLPSTFVTFLNDISMCHSVHAEKDMNEEQKYIYTSSSVDEIALVTAMSELGLAYIGTKGDYLNDESNEGIDTKNVPTQAQFQEHLLNVSGPLFGNTDTQRRFIVDEIIDFTCERRRMTVMGRWEDGQGCAISKGAEVEILSPTYVQQSSEATRNRASEVSNKFATHGLRTLAYAERTYQSLDVYHDHVSRLKLAKHQGNTPGSTLLTDIQREIETDMKLIGVTGIEDELQEGIIDTLKSLQDAGICLWVLTGDKEQTAVKVCQACEIIPAKASVISLVQCESIADTIRAIDMQIEGLNIRCTTNSIRSQLERVQRRGHSMFSFFMNLLRKSLLPNKDKENDGRTWARKQQTECLALLVDGQTLKYALTPELSERFLCLSLHCTSVVCCRTTPSQKAAVVHLVKNGAGNLLKESIFRRLSFVTAAIGDGGNDVSMLRQADIGFGILGKEGKHAVRASDYALPNFKVLKKLILVHGSWTYHRISYTILFFYYKCVCFIVPDFLHEFHTLYSDQALFENMIYTLFNLTMTTLNAIIYGSFDKCLKQKDLLKRPEMYTRWAHNAYLSWSNVIIWILEGLWHGCVCYFSAVLLFLPSSSAHHCWTAFSSNEQCDPELWRYMEADAYLFGWVIIMNVWATVLLRSAYMCTNINVFTGSAFLFLVVSNIALFFIIDVMSGVTDQRYTVFRLAVSVKFWISLFVTISITSLTVVFTRILRESYWQHALASDSKK